MKKLIVGLAVSLFSFSALAEKVQHATETGKFACHNTDLGETVYLDSRGAVGIVYVQLGDLQGAFGTEADEKIDVKEMQNPRYLTTLVSPNEDERVQAILTLPSGKFANATLVLFENVKQKTTYALQCTLQR